MAWCIYHDTQGLYMHAAAVGTDVHYVWRDPPPGLCADVERLHRLCVQVVC